MAMPGALTSIRRAVSVAVIMPPRRQKESPGPTPGRSGQTHLRRGRDSAFFPHVDFRCVGVAPYQRPRLRSMYPSGCADWGILNERRSRQRVQRRE